MRRSCCWLLFTGLAHAFRAPSVAWPARPARARFSLPAAAASSPSSPWSEVEVTLGRERYLSNVQPAAAPAGLPPLVLVPAVGVGIDRAFFDRLQHEWAVLGAPAALHAPDLLGAISPTRLGVVWKTIDSFSHCKAGGGGGAARFYVAARALTALTRLAARARADAGRHGLGEPEAAPILRPGRLGGTGRCDEAVGSGAVGENEHRTRKGRGTLAWVESPEVSRAYSSRVSVSGIVARSRVRRRRAGRRSRASLPRSSRASSSQPRHHRHHHHRRSSSSARFWPSAARGLLP